MRLTKHGPGPMNDGWAVCGDCRLVYQPNGDHYTKDLACPYDRAEDDTPPAPLVDLGQPDV